MNFVADPLLDQQPEATQEPTSEALAMAVRLLRNRQPAPILTGVDHNAAQPLSYAQEALWLFQQKQPESTAYNTVHAFRLCGALNIAALEQTVNELMRRHTILRTVYSLESGAQADELASPQQRILPFQYRPLTLIDLQGVAAEKQTERYQAYFQQASERPFDLSKEETLRVELLQLQAEEFIFVYCIHHISYDAPSERILFHELKTLYQAFCNGQLPNQGSLPKLDLQYVDFAAWQRATLSEEKLQAKLSRQAQLLANILADDELPVVELPSDKLAARVESHQGRLATAHARTEITALDPALTQALYELSRQSGFSLFNILLATFYVLLYRYTGQEKLLISTTVTNRNQAPLHHLLGIFVNPMILPATVAHNPHFLALVAQVQATSDSFFTDADVPFHRLLQSLWSAASPLARGDALPTAPPVSFNLINQRSQLELTGLTVERLDFEIGADADVMWNVRRGRNQLHLYVTYKTARFSQQWIAQMLTHYQNLLGGVVANPQQPIATLPMLSAAEYHQIVQEWNDTRVDFGPPQTIHALFEQQVARTPDAVAVVFANEQLTYAQLNTRANQLAHYLRQAGVRPETPVGVCLNRSFDLIIATLAIIKAGGAYVPLDATYPLERLQFMVQDTELTLILTRTALLERLPSTVKLVDLNALTFADYLSSNLDELTTSEHLLYIMYTSGSTGQPKGIEILHRSVQRLVKGATFAQLDATQTFLQLASLSFDAATFEIWGSLCNGAKLLLYPDTMIDLNLVGELIQKHQVTILWLTAGLFHQMIDQNVEGLKGVRQLLAGGDVLSLPHVKRLIKASGPEVTLINGYGPTENTTFTTTYRVAEIKGSALSVPIGSPISNTQVYIFDKWLQLTPVGVPGELYTGGLGLARGYLNRLELTAERFINHPEFGRLYKTGDLCRWLPDGNIEYIGRSDFQVKIRGFRIELGEIESVLLAEECVQEAVVIAREDKAGDKRLVAYVVQTPSDKAQAANLRCALQDKLPEYMIPSAFVFLDSLPLTPNGKLDRRALPPPDYYAVVQNVFVAPRTILEAKVAAIWQEVLGIAQVGVYDNFFVLGGHSLLATQVISRVRQQLHLEAPFKLLFEVAQLGEFAQRLEQLGEAIGQRAESRIPAQVRMGQPPYAFPLSFSQQRLWFLDQLEPNSAFYNIPTMTRLAGHLDVTALEASFAYLFARHESLRTTFDTVNGEAVQVIHAPQPFVLSMLAVTDAEQVRQVGQRETTTPFNLQSGPLLRVQLLKVAECEHWLLLTMHHIISDGWSVGVLMSELNHAYTAYAQGQQPTLPALRIQYADFAVWQRHYLTGDLLARQLTFWRGQLAGAPPLLELPTDRPRPPVQSYRGARYLFQLDAELTIQLQQLAQTHDATLFMGLLATFNVLLARYSRQSDIVVGTLIANRHHVEIEGLLGFVINNLVLRTSLNDSLSFIDLLAQVRQTTLAAYEHQDLPFEQLIDALQLERTLSYNPLFQVLLILQNTPNTTVNLPNLTATQHRTKLPFARFDLAIYMSENEAGLEWVLEYNTDIFDETTIARMTKHFTVLLKGIVNHPDQAVLHLPLLTAPEYQQIVHEWNDTRVDFGEPQTIHALFEQQVAQTPDAIAVINPKSEVTSPDCGLLATDSLTYAQLNARANQLAHHLIERGVKANTLVAVAMERSNDLVVSLLAVLKAGGAYVPIDPAYPLERIRFMLSDSATSLLLTQSHLQLAKECAHFINDMITVDTAEAQLAVYPKSNPQVDPVPQQLVYVIYTSGSTGQPKGAGVYVHSFMNLLQWFITEFGLTINDSVLLISSPSFDLTQKNIFAPLLVGGQLYMSREYDPEQITHTICRHKITWINCTPSAFYPLIERSAEASSHQQARPQLDSLRYLFLGGEPISSVRLQPWMEAANFHTTIVNTYGPTECTDICAAYVMPQGFTAKAIPIGHPISHARLLILDQTLQLTPIGIPGELYVGGKGLGCGYLNRPELTAERFIDHSQFGRLYKTGDLCRWLPDGNVEYLGRTDFQVKIRGFRIELGEIESALLSQAGVSSAVVVAREESPGDKRLVAYLVGDADPETVRQMLVQQLPDYMLPSAFVFLDSLPLTPNGKLDRRALPAPDYAEAQTAFVSPRNAVEAQVAAVWQAVLGLPQVGVHDNFFAMGGHSLLAIQVMTRLRQRFHREIPLSLLFESQTIAQLALALEPQPQQKGWSPLLAIAPQGTRPPFFCVHGVGGNAFMFYPLAQALAPDQPFYALQALGLDGVSVPLTSIESMATYYIEAIQAMQPQGPYLLGGYSFGGQVAFEMARQLQAQGESVAHLLLLDAPAPTQIDQTRQPVTQAAWRYSAATLAAHVYNKTLPPLAAAALEGLDAERQVATIQQHLAEAGLPPLAEIAALSPFALFKTNAEMHYEPTTPLDLPTLVLYTAKAEAQAEQSNEQTFDPTLGWQDVVTQPISCQLVPGTHTSMLRPPHVQKIAEILTNEVKGQ